LGKRKDIATNLMPVSNAAATIILACVLKLEVLQPNASFADAIIRPTTKDVHNIAASSRDIIHVA